MTFAAFITSVNTTFVDYLWYEHSSNPGFVISLFLQLTSSRIFLSHDWPQSIEHHGDLNDLLRRKTFLKGDIEKGTLGSPPLMGLLRALRPEWWFSAHLHTRYQATVLHDPAFHTATTPGNPDEVIIEDDEFPTSPASPPSQCLERTTFLALDKCLPRRQFLEV